MVRMASPFLYLLSMEAVGKREVPRQAGLHGCILKLMKGRQIQRCQCSRCSAGRSGGSCKKYCSKQGQDSQRGSCCDGLWLPTLSFQHIDQEVCQILNSQP